MEAACRSFYRHKTLIGSFLLSVLLCLTLISFLERWNPQQQMISKRISPKQVNDPAVDRRTQPDKTLKFISAMVVHRIVRENNRYSPIFAYRLGLYGDLDYMEQKFNSHPVADPEGGQQAFCPPLGLRSYIISDLVVGMSAQMNNIIPRNQSEHPLRQKKEVRPSYHRRVADEHRWESEYASRVERVRDVCNKDEIVAMRRVWRVATNRRFGKENHCKTKLCPVIVDEKRVLFFCFVPKVASTLVKRFFLNVSGVGVEEGVATNSTALHAAANVALRRVSPMYYPTTVVNRFFKIMFVRHPFDRLVSAFRSKAEKPREQVQYFYDRFFDPAMKKLRPEGSPIDKITFTEFVWYLTHTTERDYDEHWAPYWSRCDPCLVDYNFIGKLETAEHDFPYAFRKVGIESSPEWWRDFQRTPRSLTLRYFSSVPEQEVQRLYNIYKFDFELFGYSVHEFLPSGNFSVNSVR